MTSALSTIAENPESPPAPASAPLTVICGTCTECGKPLQVRAKGPGQHKRFCETKCRTRFADREKTQGQVLVTVAKVWRKSRGTGVVGKEAFAEMTRILDMLIDRDRRTNVVEGSSLSDRLAPYVERTFSSQGDYRESYIDRARL